MGPFSVTGQPNAMGGREVGGLANQLAAHMDFDDPRDRDRVRRFWNAPAHGAGARPEGGRPVRRGARGRIKAIWIVATNPAAQHAARRPGARGAGDVPVRGGLRLPGRTDTTALPMSCCPPPAGARRTAPSPIPSGCISRQRAFRPAPGEARPDWWIFAEVARPHGLAQRLRLDGPAEIFREHAALSAFENNGARVFDLGAQTTISRCRSEAMDPSPGSPTFADGRFSPRRTAGPACDRDPGRASGRSPAGPSCSTTAVSATSGTP